MKDYGTLVYFESIKREVKRRPKYEWQCDEKLKTKTEGSLHLTYTGLLGGLEHLKIETRLINERFVSVMGECVTLKWKVSVKVKIYVYSLDEGDGRYVSSVVCGLFIMKR